MKLKSELKLDDMYIHGGKYIECENPTCDKAYHHLDDRCYIILGQNKPNGVYVDLAFCSLECLIQIDSIADTLVIEKMKEEVAE
ncbi:hypothetical protein [Listeria marthii]|uniref:hypothetical protein n=1 Tax=Listeria marthii TaxID=529731 RepID=UPI0016298869|nr:hypothetical protein [Listeria marthii]MBC2040780.1 hypothetical protein [Listeria marthii]